MKVLLISKTIGVGKYAELNNEEIVAAIARHGTIKEDNGKLVKYLMDHSHFSPLQHISFGFLIETRRSISAQIFRHRSLEAQEWSLRYSEPLGFEEIDLRMEHPTNRQSSTDSFDPFFGTDKASNHIKNLFKQTQQLYDELIRFGVARETARDILPLATKTTIHITGNLRSLLSFLNVRCAKETQKECRDIAYEIGLVLEKELPNVMEKIDWRNGYFM